MILRGVRNKSILIRLVGSIINLFNKDVYIPNGFVSIYLFVSFKNINDFL